MGERLGNAGILATDKETKKSIQRGRAPGNPKNLATDENTDRTRMKDEEWDEQEHKSSQRGASGRAGQESLHDERGPTDAGQTHG